VDRTIQILCRRSKNNPLYVGDPGVGKTAIAEGLARKIVEGDVPEVLANAVIYSLDMGSLLAGTRYRGDFEERLKQVVSELEKMPHAVLFIDEIHTVIGAGATSGGAMDASNLLKPALSGGTIRCIGSTTYKEFRNHFEKDRALLRRFQKIDVNEPSIEDTIKILKGLRTAFEDHHKVKYTAEAIKTAVELSARYINDRKLPDKAIDVIDEVGAMQMLVALQAQEDDHRPRDRAGDRHHGAHPAQERVQRRQEGAGASGARSEARGLRAGQGHRGPVPRDEAEPRRSARSGQADRLVPVLGPTGVGKTEVARRLAEIMGIPLQRFDMSEYMERHSVSRLIGAPPGYVGFDQGGLLTDAIDQQPHCVLLLDDREGSPRSVQHPAAGDGQWPPDRSPRQDGGFPQCGPDHDHQCGRQRHGAQRHRLWRHLQGGRRRGSGQEPVHAGIPQPSGCHRALRLSAHLGGQHGGGQVHPAAGTATGRPERPHPVRRRSARLAG
jgi:ATP-dependent Clp protease ATP-binding subunit ClpA